jgi:hypothetical protein
MSALLTATTYIQRRLHDCRAVMQVMLQLGCVLMQPANTQHVNCTADSGAPHVTT